MAVAADVKPLTGLRPPGPLSMDSVGETWKIFKQKWSNYSIITNLDAQEVKYKTALLLHTLGDEALKVYNGFHFQTPEDQRTITEIMEKFDSFAVGEINVTYERFIFNKRQQMEGENFETFLSGLRHLSKTCDYCADCHDSILRDRIVIGIREPITQSDLLKERKLNLQTCIDLCKAAENASSHARTMRPDTTIHKVNFGKKQNPVKRYESRRALLHNKTSSRQNGERECKFCMSRHVMKKSECPAYGKTCKLCKKQNHFAKKCPTLSTGRVYTVTGEPAEVVNSDEEWIYSVHPIASQKESIKCRMLLGTLDEIFQVDTGATANMLPTKYATGLVPTVRKLKMWNNNETWSRGTCRRTITNPKNGKRYSVEFVVFDGDFTPLLGLRASLQMGLVTVNECNFERIAMVMANDKYSVVFDNKIGTLGSHHHLKVDNAVTPVVMPPRRVPVSVRPRLKSEIARMEQLGVIKPVHEPTPWVSQLVVTMKKSGAVRVCIDPRELNKALLREHFPLPILDDTLHEISESTVFSVADLSSGYWHVVLDKESSLLTTFQTPFGRYRWLRLPFGMSVSAEIFQRKLLEALDGLPGAVCIADDVLIHGKTREDHDRNLELFFKRCQETGIRLNKDKLQLRLDTITFMGHRISKDGLQSDPDKVRAIVDMASPRSVEELRRYLGMVNYLGRFLPNLSDVLVPLHMLTKKDIPWTWSETQQCAFNKVKELITNAPVLTFYHPSKELVLENDASEYGLGSALFQSGKPVAYASRTLTDTEKRYAQIEKEMLAVTFGLEKFHHYTYGRETSVFSDHKPLESIVVKPLYKAPKRLQNGWLAVSTFTSHVFCLSLLQLSR